MTADRNVKEGLGEEPPHSEEPTPHLYGSQWGGNLNRATIGAEGEGLLPIFRLEAVGRAFSAPFADSLATSLAASLAASNLAIPSLEASATVASATVASATAVPRAITPTTATTPTTTPTPAPAPPTTQTALHPLNLEIWPQERVGLIGSSGAGKSTLLSLLNGSLAPSSGTLYVLGQNLAQLRPCQRRRLQRRIGTVYQQHHLVGRLAVVHNVNGGRLGEWSWAKAAWSLVWPQEVSRVTAALDRVGLATKLYERTDRLSGGEQQRVALARILVQDPVVMIADEPVSSLDPARSREILQFLVDLVENQGKTLVISLHDVELARTYCTRLIGLRQGQLWFDRPVEEVTTAMIEALYAY